MPHLPDELVEEVFLRLPPDEPAALVRTSLVSKPWLGFLTGPAFRGRYHEFHGAPPMLGFLYDCLDVSGSEEDPPLRFLSTAKFGVRVPHLTPDSRYSACDCRHGRVLLGDMDYYPGALIWDPMTGCTRELKEPNHSMSSDNFVIAVLCAVSGCDHRSCHAGPFKVVCVGVDKSEEGECVALALVSSPDMGDWSKPSEEVDCEEWIGPCPGLDLGAHAFIREIRAVLVDDALHYLLGYLDDNDRVGILKYSLSSDSLSLIDAPRAKSVDVRASILMAMKDGCLGFAHVHRSNLYVWSRQIDSNGVATWTHHRVVDLKNLLPIENPKRRPRLIGSVECGDIIFVNTDLGVYEIDLMTLEWKEHLKTLEWKERFKEENLHDLIPYMSFYNPPERVIPGDAAH